MNLFWIGIIVFLVGLATRIFFKYRYYRDYTREGRTDTMKKEIKSRYRPMIFTGLAIEIVGVILAVIGLR